MARGRRTGRTGGQVSCFGVNSRTQSALSNWDPIALVRRTISPKNQDFLGAQPGHSNSSGENGAEPFTNGQPVYTCPSRPRERAVRARAVPLHGARHIARRTRPVFRSICPFATSPRISTVSSRSRSTRLNSTLASDRNGSLPLRRLLSVSLLRRHARMHACRLASPWRTIRPFFHNHHKRTQSFVSSLTPRKPPVHRQLSFTLSFALPYDCPCPRASRSFCLSLFVAFVSNVSLSLSIYLSSQCRR